MQVWDGRMDGGTYTHTIYGAMSKGYRTQVKEFPKAKTETIGVTR